MKRTVAGDGFGGDVPQAIVILDLLTVRITGLADARISVFADGVVVARARVHGESLNF